ncbi:MAG: hypothetical protein WCK75_07805 [Elusimicrobiota bacterium]
MTGLLLPGARLLAFTGVALGIIGLYKARKDPKAGWSCLTEPGPVLFFAAAILLWFTLSGAGYGAWDEFSHWGFAAKEMLFSNSFPAPDSALYLKDYPPGTALFQYYITCFTGWSEGATYFAQALFLFSAVLALTETRCRNNWIRVLAIIAVSCIALALFGYKLQKLYVDLLVGFLFGLVPAAYLISGRYDAAAMIRALPVLFILPLIKASGLLLALIAAAIIITDLLTSQAQEPAAGDRGKKRIILMILCAGLILAPLAASKSWGSRVKTLGLSQTFTIKPSLSAIRKSFSRTEATGRDKATLIKFKKSLLSFKIQIVLLLALSVLIFRAEKRRRERAQAGITLRFMMFGFGVYLAGMLFMYLYSFGEYEGVRAASFGRYLNIYLLGWCVALIALLSRVLPEDPEGQKPSPALTGIILLWVLFLSFSTASKFLIKLRGTPDNDIRAAIQQQIRNITPLIGLDKRVYIVWQDSKGYEAWILAYELAPRVTSTRSAPWSLGVPYYPGDIWTADWSAQAWRKNLAGYDFVLLAKTDKAFRDRFGSLFKGGLNNKILFTIPASGPLIPIKVTHNLITGN